MMTGTPVDPNFTFESFVVGAANRLAYAAARTCAEAPGSTYNPLFIYAGSGLGKTHLLMAIANAVKEIQPDLSVIYTTLERLLQDLGEGDRGARAYGAADLLLLDDLQFLSTRRDAQATLFQLLDAHLVAGRQVVLACDRPPMEMDQVDDRLLSRFSGGLVVDIARPGLETRAAILRRKLEERGAHLSAGVIEEIARLAIDNVRQLQGALHKVLAVQRAQSREIEPHEVRGLLGDLTAGMALAWGAEGTSAEGDEFSAFLTEVTRAVEQAVHGPARREELAEAVAKYEGEGFRTARLKSLLHSEPPVDPASVLAEFERDVGALKAAAAEMTQIDAQKARHPAFFDPDRVAEAEALLREARAVATVVDPFFLDTEKVVLDWPGLDDLVIEDFI